ncbi:helicase RepA family protein [Methylocystis parvus]|uniref:helicase RepA family protein n=1 Tax=Methylocystis parvus TaxID=134 RepID=UPI003C71AF3D
MTWDPDDLSNPSPSLVNGKAFTRHVGAQEEPEGFFCPPDEPAPQVTPTRKMTLEWFDDAASLALSEPSDPLIEDLLDEGAMSVFYGDSNAGKTFVALNMCFAVGTGGEWNGKRTKRGLVVFVCAEGGRKIKRRIAALKAHNGNLASPPIFALVIFPIDLRSSDANTKELLTLIRDAEKQCGERCVWIIVDTLSRAIAGGDENSPVDMGRIVAAADYIRANTGAHFTYVHHTGKDAARGARGHSLLRAATDTEIEVTAGAIKVTKQRDMEMGSELGFALLDVMLGVDQLGRAIKSAVVEWNGLPTPKAAQSEKAVPRSQRLLMDVIAEAIGDAGESFKPFGTDGPLVRGVAERAVRERYFARIAENADPDEDAEKLFDRQRKSFKRSVEAILKAKALIAAERKGERFVWLP